MTVWCLDVPREGITHIWAWPSAYYGLEDSCEVLKTG